MRIITEMARKEIETFKSQVMALVDQDSQEMLNTGLLDINDFLDEEGRLEESYLDDVSQSLADLLIESSGVISTAYEIDLANREINGDHSLANPANSHKSYRAFSLYEGQHIDGQIILSNTGELHIISSDKEGNILESDEIEIDEYHELFYCCNHLLGKNPISNDYLKFSEHMIDVEDITQGEAKFYLKNFDSNYFNSDEAYEGFMNHYFELSGDNMAERAKSILVADDTMSYILLQEDDETIGIIAEFNGDIFYHNRNSGEFKNFSEGEEFTILGHKNIAEPRILEILDVQIDGIYKTVAHFSEPDHTPEPEVKKKRGLNLK